MEPLLFLQMHNPKIYPPKSPDRGPESLKHRKRKKSEALGGVLFIDEAASFFCLLGVDGVLEFRVRVIVWFGRFNFVSRV